MSQFAGRSATVQPSVAKSLARTQKLVAWRLGASLRGMLGLVACVMLVLGVPVGASAASFSGPSSVNYGVTPTWAVNYTDDYGFGCGAGIGLCSASVYEYDSSNVRRYHSFCGDPTTSEVEPCSIVARPSHVTGENALSSSTITKYEVCEGTNIDCSSMTITWPPAPVVLTLTGVPDGNGSIRAKVTDGGYGFAGSVTLYDTSRAETVTGGYVDGQAQYWNLNGCAGPYFRAKLEAGSEVRSTGIVRLSGISSNGQPCFDDPPSGGSGAPDDGALSGSENAGGSNPSEGCCSSPQGQAGDPINTATGAFFESFDDLSIAGRGPGLELTRGYDSGLASKDSPFGYGWAFSYGMKVSVGTGGVATVVQENGSEVSFTPNGTSFVAPHRVQATLVKNGDGTWTMVRKRRVTFTFSSAGKLTAVRDLNGYATTITYPSSTSIKATDSAGRSFTFALTGSRITSVTDSSSPARSLTYGYDGSGNLTSVVDAAGGTTTFGYDASHRITTMRRPKSHGNTSTSPVPVTTNVYDSSGRVTSQTDPLGQTTTFDYATSGTTVTDPRGDKMIDRYNAYGLLISRTIGAGTAAAETSSFDYDPVTLNRTLHCDGRGYCTQRRWDSRGNLIKLIDALNKVTTYTYDALNGQTSVTTPLGVTTTKTYSATGDLLTVARPLLASDGSVAATQKTTFTYGGSAGDVTAMVDANGNTWKFTYDTFGNKTSETAPATAENSTGNKTTWTWNTGRGVPASVTKPLGNLSGATASTYTTTYAYDALNRLITTTDPAWSSSAPTLRRETVTYDGNGNQVSVRGRDGQLTTTTYDAADRRTKVERADGSFTSYAYWADGQLRSRTTSLGSVTSYAYDAAENRVSSTDPLGRLTCNTYEGDGLRSATWKLPASAGSCGARPSDHYTAYTRDPQGRLTAIDYGDGVDIDRITYDADGRKTSAVADSRTTTWTYDSLDRITKKSPPSGGTQRFTYDLANNATVINYGSFTATRTFDAAGRMTSVTDSGNRKFTFAYDANSNLKTTTYPTASGNQDTYTYEPATDRMTQAKISKSGTALATYSYTRDSAGRVATATTTGATDQAQSDAYTASGRLARSGPSSGGYVNAYDADQQLTSMPTSANAASTQRYDAAGELCWSTTTASATGACTAPPTGARTYGYNAAGDRTSSTLGAATTTYAYNDAHLLKEVVSAGNPIASYEYDTEGLRARKTDAGGTSSSYSWDTTTGPSTLLSDGANYYVYGPGNRPIEQVEKLNLTPTYLHTDQLGSVRYLTSTTGAYAGQVSFNAYGKPQSIAGQTSPLGYAGQLTDNDTGLIYMRARMYDPSTGQFTTVDPLVDITEQPYAYADGDPVNRYDPTGSIGVEAVPEGGPVAVGTAARGAAVRVSKRVAASVVASTYAASQLIAPTELGNGCGSGLGSAAGQVGLGGVAGAGLGVGIVLAKKKERNPAQDKKLPKSEVEALEEAGLIDVHGGDKIGKSKSNIFYDGDGNIYEKPYGGEGPGEPLNINRKELK